MTRRTRKSLFYGLCAVFLLGGTAVIFYALGWRMDFEPFGIKKVGAIYVRSFPSSAAITLNGLPMQNKSGLLDKGTFINNLFPKNYFLELSADGYQTWKEHVNVAPSLVSELKYAVLVPSAANAIEAGSSTLVEGLSMPGAPTTIAWTEDKNYVITKDEPTGIYFLNGKNLGFKPSEIMRDPGAGNRFLVRNGNSIFLFDPSTDTALLNRVATTTELFAASASRLAWARFDETANSSTIVLYDRFSKTSAPAFEFTGKTSKIAFRNDDVLDILQQDGGLYSFRIGSAQPEKIADRVKDFFVSPEKNFIAALEPESIEIFSLEGEKKYWRFRLPDNASIERLAWYADENHLFIFYPAAVNFLDLSDNSLENFRKIIDAKAAAYDQDSNSLYFSKDSRIWKLEFSR
jgi:hypothetical protein